MEAQPGARERSRTEHVTATVLLRDTEEGLHSWEILLSFKTQEKGEGSLACMLPLVPLMKQRLPGNAPPPPSAFRARSVGGVTTTPAQRPIWQLILPTGAHAAVITTTEK